MTPAPTPCACAVPVLRQRGETFECIRCLRVADDAAEGRAVKSGSRQKKGAREAGKHRVARIDAFAAKVRRNAKKRKARQKLTKRHAR